MTTIVICADAVVPADISIPGARIEIVEDLCDHPSRLADAVPDDEDHVVLGLHRSRYNLGVVQAAVRRTGFDPLAVGLMDLQTVGSSADLPNQLAAAVARTLMIPKPGPEHVKMLMPDRSTRRALLSIGKPRYVGAPAIDAAICRADDGCRACVDPCPAHALSWAGGEIQYDKNTCIACGICVTACPAGAVANPSATPAAIEAELRAVIDGADEPPGIRFRCREARAAAEPGWHQVEVPCTGMLTVGWILAPMIMGAGSVDVVFCSDGGCSLVNDRRLTSTLADVATIASHLGLGLDERMDLNGPVPHNLLGQSASARNVETLATQSPPTSTVDLHTADIGTVTIDRATCTVCQMCARVCPTDALASRESGQSIELSFDPLTCTACGGCVQICPEVGRGAIALQRRVDIDDWALGRRPVRKEERSMCELCGRPVAPKAMLDRIQSMLGDDADATMAVIGRRCLVCRGR